MRLNFEQLEALMEEFRELRKNFIGKPNSPVIRDQFEAHVKSLSLRYNIALATNTEAPHSIMVTGVITDIYLAFTFTPKGLP